MPAAMLMTSSVLSLVMSYLPGNWVLERDIFRSSFSDAWKQTKAFFLYRDPTQIELARQDPKHKMALVFRSYLGRSSTWANDGESSRRIDYQIWCGPSLGAFNAWIGGSFLDNPQHRKTVTVALNLLYGAAVLTRVHLIRSQGVQLPAGADEVRPRPLEEILPLLGAA